MLKMPYALRGLGALQRRMQYGVEDYYKLVGSKDYTETI